jgi:hypothetical protein
MGRSYAKMDIGTLFSIREVQEGFRRVPPDAHVPDKTRKKDLARFTSYGGDIVKAPHGVLFHPVNANSYGDEASRSYDEIPACDIGTIVPIVQIFMRVSRISDGQEILVQRQRVACSETVQLAKTVREGAHQDGVQKLGILCIDRVNVEGGISFLYNAQRELQFAGILQPGDLLFIDDVTMFHDTTPIWRVKTDRPGYRDIIILTWPSDRKEIGDVGNCGRFDTHS